MGWYRVRFTAEHEGREVKYDLAVMFIGINSGKEWRMEIAGAYVDRNKLDYYMEWRELEQYAQSSELNYIFNWIEGNLWTTEDGSYKLTDIKIEQIKEENNEN